MSLLDFKAWFAHLHTIAARYCSNLGTLAPAQCNAVCCTRFYSCTCSVAATCTKPMRIETLHVCTGVSSLSQWRLTKWSWRLWPWTHQVFRYLIQPNAWRNTNVWVYFRGKKNAQSLVAATLALQFVRNRLGLAWPCGARHNKTSSCTYDVNAVNRFALAMHGRQCFGNKGRHVLDEKWCGDVSKFVCHI